MDTFHFTFNRVCLVVFLINGSSHVETTYLFASFDSVFQDNSVVLQPVLGKGKCIIAVP